MELADTLDLGSSAARRESSSLSFRTKLILPCQDGIGPGGGQEVKAMQQKIHPKYEEVSVNCNCGASFKTKSTKTSDITLDICSSCHPFYTGTQKLIDTEGRVDKFKQRFAGFGKPKK